MHGRAVQVQCKAVQFKAVQCSAVFHGPSAERSRETAGVCVWGGGAVSALPFNLVHSEAGGTGR